MRISLLILALAATFVLAPSASAQRTVKAWYQLKSGDQVELIQTDRVRLIHGKGETRALVNGRTIDFRGPVELSYQGTGDQPQPTAQSDRGSSSTASGSGGGNFTTSKTETVVGFDGTVTTKTTTTQTDSQTGSTTTTTTTTTTTSDGETTTETTTEQDD